MYLKSLELSGFKSFAKKSSLSFTTPITGIVGPNGSGKSNTAEAFRFVLGEQSIKSLRGKRGEDMIWNGGGETGQSGSSGRANRASAKLTFDNSGHFDGLSGPSRPSDGKLFSGIDFDEVTIERVVHRDNSNEYFLNGSQVRLKDIIELLATAHIGATGHHIISQGEADRILSASIRERREMIEDALGLKIYQWKKLESIRKLERTDENMERVASLRREIAPHLRFLKKQVEKVEKAEEMRRELVALYKDYFAHEDIYIRSEKERLNNEISGPRKELAELDRELERAKKILTDSKNKDKKSDEVIAFEGKLAQIRLEKDTIMRELGRLEGEISANKRAIEKEESRLKSEETRTVYLKDVEEVVRTVESFGSIEDAKRLFGEVISALKAFIARHRSNTDSALIVDMEQEITKLSKERDSLESKLSSLSGTETKYVCEYNELKQTIEKEKDTNRDAEKDVFRIIARQNEVRNVVGNLTVALNSIAHEEAAFKRELGEAGIIAGREAINYHFIVIPAKAGIQDVRIRSKENSAQLQVEVSQNLDESMKLVALDPSRSLPLATNRGWDDSAREIQTEKRKQIEKIKIRLEDSGAAGGAEVMKEYRETEERDVFLGHELEDLEKAKKELLALIVDLEVRIDYEFKSGILKINTEFQKFFALMFGGGKAELTVVKEIKRRRKSDMEDLSEALGGVGYEERSMMNDSRMGDDRASSLVNRDSDLEEGPEGLDVNVSLPRKKVKGLMMLSGGERALTSIALIFAVSQVNPPPFIILDETDAALDEANSKKYGDMIESLSKHSQLILITHNRETMSRAGVLYGVTMSSDGASKLLSIQFEEAVQVAK